MDFIDELLNEEPKNIGDLRMAPGWASSMYAKYVDDRNNIQLEEMYPGGILYRNKSKFFILDSNIKAVSYYVETGEKNIFGHKASYQQLVWRNVSVDDTNLVPIRVLFKYIFPIHNMVVSDKEQSRFGSRFWLVAITRAIREGYHVYYTNLLLKKNFTPLASADDAMEKAKDLWGDKERHKAVLLVISREPLAGVSEEMDKFGIPLSES